MTIVLHRLTRGSANAWIVAALYAGLAAVGAVLLIALLHDSSILTRME
jgi:zinc transporter ZupT